MKLFLRIDTPIGPRTLVSQGHDSEVAHAIKLAIETLNHGNYAEVVDDGAVLPMKEIMRRRKLALVRKQKKDMAASNVTQLASARRAKS